MIYAAEGSMFTRLCLTFVIIALWLTVSATAQPVTWYVSGVAFGEGGTGSGSFNYDADTNTYTNIDITTTASITFPGGHYGFVNFSFANTSSQLTVVTSSASDPLNLPVLGLNFTQALTGFGGTSNLFGSIEGLCGGTCNGIIVSRLLSEGTVGSSETLQQFFAFGG